jgi:archaellum component FlaC
MKAKKESIDEKIDNLAIMVAKGFDVAHKEIRQLKGDFDGLRGDFDELREDVNRSLENHIKDVRTDYDNLSHRVSIVERKITH